MDFKKTFEEGFKPFNHKPVVNDYSFGFDGLDDEDLDSEFTGDFEADYSNYIAMRKGKKSTAKRFQRNMKTTGQKMREKQNPISIYVPTDRGVQIYGAQKLCYEKVGSQWDKIVLNIVNDNSFDITVDLFRPSTPYLYTQSTSLNINELITVGGGETILYTDLLNYLTANITRLSKIRVSGDNHAQLQVPLTAKSLNFKADQLVIPKPFFQSIFQYDKFAVEANLDEILSAPFFVDGLQWFQYTVLAGNNVTLGFDFKQIRLRDLLVDDFENEKFELK